MLKATTIDDYIALAAPEALEKLHEIRSIISKAAPKASECISYSIPAFRQNRVLVYFAGYKKHIGFYPTSSGIRVFAKQLAKYKSSKGAVQFPLDEPLPAKLISDIVKHRVKEDAAEKELLASPKVDWTAGLSTPARRALSAAGIKTAKQLAKHSEADILKLHGIGPTAIPRLKAALKEEGLTFKK